MQINITMTQLALAYLTQVLPIFWRTCFWAGQHIHAIKICHWIEPGKTERYFQQPIIYPKHIYYYAFITHNARENKRGKITGDFQELLWYAQEFVMRWKQIPQATTSTWNFIWIYSMLILNL